MNSSTSMAPDKGRGGALTVISRVSDAGAV